MASASNTRLPQANTRSGAAASQTPQATNTGTAQVSTRFGAAVSQRDPRINMDSGDIIRATDELKNYIKGHNDCLKQEIIQLRQEVNGKLNKLATAAQSLSDHTDDAESRVEQMAGWTEEATEMLCTYLKQQRTCFVWT